MRKSLKEVELNIAIDVLKKKYIWKLPTQEKLCLIYGVSRSTVQKVLRNLVEKNVIGIRKNKYYIIPPESTAGEYVMQKFAENLAECDLILKMIGFSKKEISDLLGLKKVIYQLPIMIENVQSKVNQKIKDINEIEVSNEVLNDNELDDMSKLMDKISFNFENTPPENLQEKYREILEDILL